MDGINQFQQDRLRKVIEAEQIRRLKMIMGKNDNTKEEFAKGSKPVGVQCDIAKMTEELIMKQGSKGFSLAFALQQELEKRLV